MFHAKFQNHSPSGSGEEDLYRFLLFIVRQRNSIFLVDLDLRCIENVLTDNHSQHLQEQEST